MDAFETGNNSPNGFERGSEQAAVAEREDPALFNSNLIPSKTIRIGRQVIFGAQEVKPIWNIPANALRIRIRLRNDQFAMAFVKFEDRIEQWAIGLRDNIRDAAEWELMLLQSVNFRKVLA